MGGFAQGTCTVHVQHSSGVQGYYVSSSVWESNRMYAAGGSYRTRSGGGDGPGFSTTWRIWDRTSQLLIYSMRTAARVGGPGKGKEIGNQLLYNVDPGSYPTLLDCVPLFNHSSFTIAVILLLLHQPDQIPVGEVSDAVTQHTTRSCVGGGDRAGSCPVATADR
jgi:hypothetical protein